MWIVHIDSWNYADPAKIVDLIPEDVLPYVVFNISLSINWDSTNHKWLMVQDGYACAKSWLRTCTDKGVWTMIQPSSGGQSHFPDYNASTDYEDTIFAEFFRDYPNFIGYNYCEQFWDFESADFPITCKQRYQHFAAVLELCNRMERHRHCHQRSVPAWNQHADPHRAYGTEWRHRHRRTGTDLGG